MPNLARNPRAKYDYRIIEAYEGGLVLSGQEVKSIRSGRMSLKGSYVTIKGNEAWLINAHIPPYQEKNSPPEYDPYRTRKILLSKEEIKSLIGKIKAQGLTLVPIRVYNRKKKIKLEFGLGRGKRKKDKRESIKRREAKRRIERALRKRE